MRRYNPKVIEPKWQKIWDESKIYEVKEPRQLVNSRRGKPKRYILEYFPYPSGVAMHVGHVRNYTIGDAMARHSRMTGHNVLHPMGWDAFGLPAENFAIKNNISPRESTDKNIKTFKQQLKQLGFSYDWSREIDSSKPDYYQWTQWLFLQFYKKDLAYRAKTLQNWCPTDKTVLANEQVINKNGVNVCERDGTPVTQKEVEQWFLKITDYADRLVDDLDDLDWPESIKMMQRNWIGRSIGAEIDFKINKESLEVISYVMGVDDITDDLKKVGVKIHSKTTSGSFKVSFPYRKAADFEKLMSEKLKPGFWNEYIAEDVVFIFKDKKGATKRIIWDESDEVKLLKLCNEYASASFPSIREMLEGNDWYGGKVDNVIRVFTTRPDTIFGATYLVLAPEHPLVSKLTVESQKSQVESYVKETLNKTELDRKEAEKDKTGVFTGAYAINPASKEKIPIWIADYVLMSYGTGAIMAVPAHDERDHDFAKKYGLKIQKVIEAKDLPYEGEGLLIESGKYSGLESAQAREKMAKDFGKEQTQYRLRDWTVSRQRYWGCPIPIIYCDKDGIVPVPEEDLPVLLPEDVKFKPTGQSPLKGLPQFLKVNCPTCGGEAERETDTFDTFIDSSWYFLRFCDPRNDKKPFDRELAERWLPVDSYIGGAEHAVVHLLYARFWTKVLTDIGLVGTNEPFKSLRNHGMIGGPDGRKMGKRYGNVVTPNELIDQGYGADALRLYELFIGPYDQGVDWNPRGIVGTYRFLDRIWTLVFEFLEETGHRKQDIGHNSELGVQIQRIVHKTAKRVTEDLETLGFNTAIAALMEAVNELYKVKTKHNFTLAHDAWRDGLIALVQLLAPFAPHISEELWEELGQSGSVHISKWPAWNETLIAEETVTLAVQVNGKVRSEITVPVDLSESEVVETAKADEKIAKAIAGKKIKKAIYIPGRLVSLVV